MKGKGKIKELKKITVSDPSYGKNAWCRYLNENINIKNCEVDIKIESVEEEGLESGGLTIFILMKKPNVDVEIAKDGFKYDKRYKISETKIGMDTACVAIGINELSDEIEEYEEFWQPEFALRSLTDGFFGNVVEGSFNGEITFLVITGFLSDDTFYSEEDLVNYFVKQLQISDLELENNNENVNGLRL